MKFEWDEARKTGKGHQNSIDAVLRKRCGDGYMQRRVRVDLLFDHRPTTTG